MNYAKILKADIANGIGFRVTLYVSGCCRNCKGCFNKDAQDPNFGKYFDDEAKKKIFTELDKEWCSGLSLLGGEPMSCLSDNRKQIISLVKEVKEKYPNKNIWMWSGYTIEELALMNDCKDVLKYIDVLVDGEFIEELKNISLVWKGSSNQRVIDVNEYNKSHKIVELF